MSKHSTGINLISSLIGPAFGATTFWLAWNHFTLPDHRLGYIQVLVTNYAAAIPFWAASGIWFLAKNSDSK